MSFLLTSNLPRGNIAVAMHLLADQSQRPFKIAICCTKCISIYSQRRTQHHKWCTIFRTTDGLFEGKSPYRLHRDLHGLHYLAKLVERTRHALAACGDTAAFRSEEHTSELQSRENLVCRLLLEKKKERKECT